MRQDYVVIDNSEFAGREVVEIAKVFRTVDGTPPVCNARVVAFVPGTDPGDLNFAREIADALNEKLERDRESSRAAAKARTEKKARREQSAGGRE